MPKALKAILGAVGGAILGFIAAFIVGSQVTPESEMTTRIVVQLIIFVPGGAILGGILAAHDP